MVLLITISATFTELFQVSPPENGRSLLPKRNVLRFSIFMPKKKKSHYKCC